MYNQFLFPFEHKSRHLTTTILLLYKNYVYLINRKKIEILKFHSYYIENTIKKQYHSQGNNLQELKKGTILNETNKKMKHLNLHTLKRYIEIEQIENHCIFDRNSFGRNY